MTSHYVRPREPFLHAHAHTKRWFGFAALAAILAYTAGDKFTAAKPRAPEATSTTQALTRRSPRLIIKEYQCPTAFCPTKKEKSGEIIKKENLVSHAVVEPLTLSLRASLPNALLDFRHPAATFHSPHCGLALHDTHARGPRDCRHVRPQSAEESLHILPPPSLSLTLRPRIYTPTVNGASRGAACVVTHIIPVLLLPTDPSIPTALPPPPPSPWTASSECLSREAADPHLKRTPR